MTSVWLVLAALGYVTFGYLAGRLHGKAAHHRFLARGFRTMRDQVEARGLGDRHMDDLTASAADVSHAFGSRRLR